VSRNLPWPVVVMGTVAGLLAMGFSGLALYGLGFWRTRGLRLLAAFLSSVAFMLMFLLFLGVSSGVKP